MKIKNIRILRNNILSTNMEILKLKAHEKMLEFKTMDYITIYGIYDDEATFGDALNSFFNN